MYSDIPLLSYDPNRPGQKDWELKWAFKVCWGGQIFEVPALFRTDLASIPRIMRSLVPQVGAHIQPAIVHDYIYAGNGDWTREEADQMFLDGMEYVGVGYIKRYTMYWAVRAAGGLSWKGKVL